MRLSMRRALRLVTLLAILAALGATAACSKKSSPTSPPPGGSRELDSGDLGLNAMYPHTFTTGGVYGYHCERHTNMTGTVSVVAGNPMTATVNIVNSTDLGFQPMNAEVAPGGTVTWVNTVAVVHTVTSNP